MRLSEAQQRFAPLRELKLPATRRTAILKALEAADLRPIWNVAPRRLSWSSTLVIVALLALTTVAWQAAPTGRPMASSARSRTISVPRSFVVQSPLHVSEHQTAPRAATPMRPSTAPPVTSSVMSPAHPATAFGTNKTLQRSAERPVPGTALRHSSLPFRETNVLPRTILLGAHLYRITDAEVSRVGPQLGESQGHPIYVLPDTPTDQAVAIALAPGRLVRAVAQRTHSQNAKE